MWLSSGARNALAEAGMWVAAACFLVAAIIYFEEIKSVVAWHHSPVTAESRLATPRAASNTSNQKSSTTPAYTDTSGTVRLNAGHHGHFFADASINGSTIRVLVDTGASLVALSHEDARRAGIFVGEGDYKYTTSTANGQARIAIVELARVSIGSIMVYNVRAAVGEPGALKTTLLGMSFLGKLRRTEMRQGQLILEN